MITPATKLTQPAAPTAQTAMSRSAARGYALAASVELAAVCLDARGATAATLACVTELAQRCHCERVSFGRLERGGQLQLKAMSGSARLAARSNLVRSIEAAMTEALEQARTIVLPAPGEQVVGDREHAVLSGLHGDAPVLSVPFAFEGEMTGVFTFERAAGAPFEPLAVELAQTSALLCGPLLDLKHRDERPLHIRTMTAVGAVARMIAGPRRPGLKLALIAGAVVLAAMTLSTGTHRITAQAKLEGSVHHAVVAPFDGFVESAQVRPGDEVIADAPLCRLEDRELRVELRKWQGELEQLRQEYRGARAAHDRAESAIASTRMARAQAQIELLESQLARTELRAPFAGVVIAGDLSQLLGSPVTRGDVLFEIAPLNDYRVVLEVDERDMDFVRTGQPGRLALQGLPGTPLVLSIERITPVAIASDGRNFFRVEARVESDAQRLRPGMAGVARIEVGEERLLWLWTHRAVEWLHLRLWTWLP